MSAFQEFERDHFENRHLGPNSEEQGTMLKSLGYTNLDELCLDVVPENIRLQKQVDLPQAESEKQALRTLRKMVSQNKVFKSYIGLGYADTFVPAVIQRNILENPGWYTQYTPYQAEISQGRLEALLNFQTLISDLTGLPIANSSLLDEGTAAAEAMALSFAVHKQKRKRFFVSQNVYPQSLEVIQTRAKPLGIEVVVDDPQSFQADDSFFGALIQNPDQFGKIHDWTSWIQASQNQGLLVTVAADILSLVLLKSPGEMGADMAIGNTQRFGVPMGFGGPHAAYFATKEDHKRLVPGRIVGVSKDRQGKRAVRLALQTREQHIRREKATSNICTSQVLLAIMASMYAVYHGPEGLYRIAHRVHALTEALTLGLKRLGYAIDDEPRFDTVLVGLGSVSSDDLLENVRRKEINLRKIDDQNISITLDEAVTLSDLQDLLDALTPAGENTLDVNELIANYKENLPKDVLRKDEILTNEVFHAYRSETEMLRYMQRLQSKDLSLAHSMIPLGSCTMKLNATSEMIPITWNEVAHMHPFAPLEQAQGYLKLFEDLEGWLCELTGFTGFSLQPNAGSQGEYAGLLTIHDYHQHRGEGHRNICLIPTSAHGTNPASAVMAGMKVVAVKCDDNGNTDLNDLKAKAELHKENLSALMITYPSTHGVFEEDIKTICQIVHDHGGLVYMDGANFNAQIGLCNPGEIGADVCHLNLHKTFCIPHGGGGPGMGPIGVNDLLKPFLPGHNLAGISKDTSGGAISAAPWGSAAILPISWMYIAMMGADGLKRATQVAILSANYIAKKLEDHYPVLYKGKKGLVAHECIIDLRFLKKLGLSVEDVAKRLIDYGFHAPTMSWPVAGTLMIEPTESEALPEVDRFIDAMIAIRKEIKDVEEGKVEASQSVLANSPHPAEVVTQSSWDYPYSREEAAYPLEWVKTRKFWPAVSRIDNAFGDRNLICTCDSVEEYEA